MNVKVDLNNLFDQLTTDQQSVQIVDLFSNINDKDYQLIAFNNIFDVLDEESKMNFIDKTIHNMMEDALGRFYNLFSPDNS